MPKYSRCEIMLHPNCDFSITGPQDFPIPAGDSETPSTKWMIIGMTFFSRNVDNTLYGTL